MATRTRIKNNNLVLKSTATAGIKLDEVAEDYGWTDLTGVYFVDSSGTAAPSIELFDTGLEDLGYNISDKVRFRLHTRHNMRIGGNKHFHFHIGKSVGTTASGNNLVLTTVMKYCYNSARGLASPAPLTFTTTITPTQLNAIPSGAHGIFEFLIAQSGGGASLFDSDLWLPDDLLLTTTTITTFPTLTGGLSQKIFIPFADGHEQVRDGSGTKYKDLSTGSFYGTT